MAADVDREFGEIVKAAQSPTFGASEVAALAARLADSGTQLRWPTQLSIADIPSTGGPASLSTLIGPLILRSLGWTVVKLGVPGRPAGAIDSLGTLGGYRVTLTPEEVRSVVERCHFSHFMAGNAFAPMDAALFEYRLRRDATAVPPLAAASILSKKLAVGVRAVSLDVRVGSHGNFGRSWSDARSNARLFCDAARILGIDAVAVLASTIDTIQPLIGRGEALLGLAIAAGLVDLNVPGLDAHLRHCRLLAEALEVHPESSLSAGDAVSPPLLLEQLGRHLAAQGSSIDELGRRVDEVQRQPKRVIVARSEGFVHWDLAAIRRAIVRRQQPPVDGLFDDPAGVQLMARFGASVRAGGPLLEVRCREADMLDELVTDLTTGFRIDRALEPQPVAPLEVLRG